MYRCRLTYDEWKCIVDKERIGKLIDTDKLQEALQNKDITQEQYDRAIATSDKLQKGLCSDIKVFQDYVQNMIEVL